MLEHSDDMCMKRASQILFIILIIQTTSAWGTFVATQESVIFADNLTLVVEDVDTMGGEVWLKLYDENGTVKSEVSRVGEHFAYDEGDIQLFITNIYAGDESDLVAFEVNRGVISKRQIVNVSDVLEDSKVPEKSPGFDIISFVILAIAMIVTRRIKARRPE